MELIIDVRIVHTGLFPLSLINQFAVRELQHFYEDQPLPRPYANMRLLAPPLPQLTEGEGPADWIPGGTESSASPSKQALHATLKVLSATMSQKVGLV